jgi:hypothetical protein
MHECMENDGYIHGIRMYYWLQTLREKANERVHLCRGTSGIMRHEDLVTSCMITCTLQNPLCSSPRLCRRRRRRSSDAVHKSHAKSIWFMNSWNTGPEKGSCTVNTCIHTHTFKDERRHRIWNQIASAVWNMSMKTILNFFLFFAKDCLSLWQKCFSSLLFAAA